MSPSRQPVACQASPSRMTQRRSRSFLAFWRAGGFAWTRHRSSISLIEVGVTKCIARACRVAICHAQGVHRTGTRRFTARPEPLKSAVFKHYVGLPQQASRAQSACKLSCSTSEDLEAQPTCLCRMPDRWKRPFPAASSSKVRLERAIVVNNLASRRRKRFSGAHEPSIESPAAKMLRYA
jgi:hypothetical protein